MVSGAVIAADISDTILASPAHALAADPTIECISKIKLINGLHILKGKVELEDASDPPIEILTNSSVPAKNEKGAISLWISEQTRCRKLGEEWRNNNLPSAINTLSDKAYSEVYLLAADLYARKMSYGDFAKTKMKIYHELMVNISSEKQQILQRQQAEIQERETLRRRQELTEQQRVLAQRQVEQQQALAQQQEMAAACNRARETMNSFCVQSEASLRRGRADMYASFNCGHWQVEVTRLCSR